MSIISLKKCSISYPEKKLFEGINIELLQGEKAVLIGPSGIGKTSLLLALQGFVTGVDGVMTVNKLRVDAANIKAVRRLIGYLPQSIQAPANVTVAQLIERIFSFSQNKNVVYSHSRMLELALLFRLSPDVTEKEINSLSGGEKQRIFLVILVLLEKKILLLDEPVSALDAVSRNIVTDYLFSQHDLSILSVSHQDEWISSCTRAIDLEQWKIG